MKRFLLLPHLLIFLSMYPCFSQTIIAGRMNEVFQKTDLSGTGVLNNPWEITYGPDDSLWVTESKGYKVYKMSPVNVNAKRVILDISLGSTWLGNTPSSDSVFNMQFVIADINPQGGLAGLAIHPEFNAATPKKYVYISYVRSYLGTGGGTGYYFQNRIVRFTYNPLNGKLANPVSLCDTLPGSNDHNSQRMIIAPVNGVNYLFYAQGDMGAGQLSNTSRPNHAQDASSYEGKILRFNLEPDGDAGALDQWIPNDNPFNGTAQSAVWSTGIRNNQGFAYDSVRNILYGASHGPYSDDEVNIIEPGKNYGHPLVVGYAADGNYDGSGAGANSGSSIPTIVSEAANAASIGASYKDPMFSAYARPQSEINNIWVTNPSNSTWPSEAWSGVGLYNYSNIPGWKNSLLFACLKWGRVIRAKLNAAGTAVDPVGGLDTVSYFEGVPRYRDVAFGRNGKDIFIAMDNSNSSAGGGANIPQLTQCFGCIQRFTFLGYQSVGGTSTISDLVPIASGKPNICEDANSVTINATNTNLWVPITDTSGNIVAEINANGNLLGNVTTSLYVNSGPVREEPVTHSLYLDRNITITPQNQPTGTVSVRLYLNNGEFTALANATNSQGQSSGVVVPSNLAIFKNENACGATVSGKATSIPTTNQAAFGTGGYAVQANITSFSTFYIASVNAALPLHLVSFKGSLNNDIAILNWITEDAQGTKTFILERSINTRDFYPVMTLPTGNATGRQSWSYNDSIISRLSSPVVYYRLKIIDEGGAYTYSTIVTINLNNNKATLTVRPNPVINNVTADVDAAVTGQANWELTDAAGKMILQHTVILTRGKNVININMSNVPAGTYYLKLAGNTISKAIKLQKL